jgi:hypothetical protein
MKKCYNCKIEKDGGEFSASQLKRRGSLCRACNTKITKEYRDKNSDKIKKYQQEYDASRYQGNKLEILEYKKEYYQDNKIEILKDRKEYYQENKEDRQVYNKLYYKENKKQILEKDKEYRIKNLDKIRKYQNGYCKKRRQADFSFRLKCSISANISFYLKSNGFSKNKKSTIKYLPYSIKELKEHLEKLFEPWMNWNNYGKYYSKIWEDNSQSTWTWQIDHIIPHSTFKYCSMADQEFRECWSLNNLRPLSSKQNFLEGMKRTRH